MAACFFSDFWQLSNAISLSLPKLYNFFSSSALNPLLVSSSNWGVENPKWFWTFKSTSVESTFLDSSSIVENSNDLFLEVLLLFEVEGHELPCMLHSLSIFKSSVSWGFIFTGSFSLTWEEYFDNASMSEKESDLFAEAWLTVSGIFSKVVWARWVWMR